MYPGDARSKWPPTLRTDRRVVHYWDETRVIGRLYLPRLPAMTDRRATATLRPTGDALWDAFFLYPPGGGWEDPVPLPIRWGYPIMVTRDQLRSEVDGLVQK